jgi:hypothetical protein
VDDSGHTENIQRIVERERIPRIAERKKIATRPKEIQLSLKAKT